MTIPASAIAQSRALALASMQDTASLFEPITVTNPSTKIRTTTYAATPTATAPCRLDSLTADEKQIADAQNEQVDAVVVLPAETAVGHGWRITVAGTHVSGGAWAETFDVEGVDAPRSYEVVRRVRVRALRGGETA